MQYSTKMPPASPTPKWRLAAGALVALALLNSSLTFENVWPTPKIRWASTISIELVVCVLLLAIAYRWAGALARRVLPALWVILVTGHYLDVTAPGIYGREFNLYWDSQYLGNVAAMLSRAAPTWLILLAAVSLLAVFVALFVAARIALRWLASAMEWPVSLCAPPTSVEKSRALPDGPNFVMKASLAPCREDARAPARGKSADAVCPTTYASPEESTAMASPSSLPMPPKYVE